MGSTRDKLKWAGRKTVKWGGAVLTVLLLVVWIGSGWRDASVSSNPSRWLSLRRGQLRVQLRPFDAPVLSTRYD